jgi:hypothetical protein
MNKPMYYVPSWLKCPSCKYSLMSESKDMSDDGKVTLFCSYGRCDRSQKRMEVQLPSLAYIDLDSTE